MPGLGAVGRLPLCAGRSAVRSRGLNTAGRERAHSALSAPTRVSAPPFSQVVLPSKALDVWGWGSGGGGSEKLNQ